MQNLQNNQQLEIYFQGLSQWTSNDGKTFVPANKSVGELPPGIYNIDVLPGGMIGFSKLEAKTEELIRFPNANSDQVIDEIRKFWTKRETFERFGLPFKRGILLYGPPGSGKTCTVRFVMQDVQELGGIVINFRNISMFELGFRALRQIQPQTPVVVIMEDLDSLIHMQHESMLLNLLDGFGNIDNTVFLATTNYPERLSERIINRPSRFDRRFQIDFPNAESRRIYLDTLFAKLTEEEKARIPAPERWVTETKNMSLAHVKELFLAVNVLENEFTAALQKLKNMNEKGFRQGANSGHLGKMQASALPISAAPPFQGFHGYQSYQEIMGQHNPLLNNPLLNQMGTYGFTEDEEFGTDWDDPALN
jgi:hypothetical protein